MEPAKQALPAMSRCFANAVTASKRMKRKKKKGLKQKENPHSHGGGGNKLWLGLSRQSLSACLFLLVHLNKISGNPVFSSIQVAVKGLPAKPLIKNLMYNMMAAEKPISGTDAVSSRITLPLWDYSCGGSATESDFQWCINVLKGVERQWQQRIIVFFFAFHLHVTLL